MAGLTWLLVGGQRYRWPGPGRGQSGGHPGALPRVRVERPKEYALRMKKRITLSLDDDIVEALQARGARSLSSAANDALREAVADDAHRASLLAWLDELDAAHGPPAAQELAAADELLDALEQGEPLPGGAPGRVSAA